jgi:transcriptional regulator with GAF, ATPase, and Fis domain
MEKYMSHAISYASAATLEHGSALCRAKLRACSALGESALILAKGLVELSEALSAAIFLLDYTQKHLICSAVYPNSKNTHTEKQNISINILHDPLCFCLSNGQPYNVSIVRDVAFPSSVYLHTDALNLEAIPLFAQEERLIGALLLSFDKESPKHAATYALCDYGAMIMASIMQKERSSSLVHSLENDLALLQKGAKERASRRMIGESSAIRAVRDQLTKLALSDAHVLITGETGTGKELAAEIIHDSSRRSDKTFLKINCGALPATLLESELFGYKQGAFSGAVSDHMGLLRSANGGTVLLDEIGEMPAELQVKLLRVLQENTIRPLGDIRHYPLNVRILAATNVDIQQSMKSGKLRSDLYHRLAVFHINLPALHERREDIPLLALHFLKKICTAYHRPPITLSRQVLAALCEHSYPGNVRELAACVERAILMMEPNSNMLNLKHIFPSMDKSTKQNLLYYLARYESLLIINALKQHDGNITETAKELGIPRRTLGSKIQRLSLEFCNTAHSLY